MADDGSMDSDSYAGSKRRFTTDSEQEEETLPQLRHSSNLSEVTTDLCDQGETFMEDSGPKKTAQCLSLLPEGNQDLGLHSSTESASLSASFEKEIMKVDVKAEDGLSGVQEGDSQVNAIEAKDDDNKGHRGIGLEFEEKRDIKEKDVVSDNLLEAEKKRLLADLEAGKLFTAKTSSVNSSGLPTNLTKTDGNNGITGIDFPVRGCLMVEVIDDTALIESFPVSKIGNASVKDEKKKGKQETDGKKARRSRRKSKNLKRALEEAERLKESTEFVGIQNCRKESNGQNKIMYSREELKALRFLNVAEQRKFWLYIYNGLGDTVMREYDDLGSWKNQKNIGLISDAHNHSGKKAASPAVMFSGEEYSEIVDNELEYREENETEKINPSDLTFIHGFGVEDDTEEEYIEDDDSDQDYTSILKPAFMVDGEPDFDSGPPEDGLEYLRRVRWEAAQIPKVKIAKPDRIKSNKEQTLYMPQIPEIAKCAEYLLPSKQWEEAFLADFSELHLTVSHLEDSDQLLESAVEKFNNSTAYEVYHSDHLTSPSNAADSCVQNLGAKSKSSITDTCGDYPTLSSIRKMDSVARVSMLRKRINLVEPMASLSKTNCMWLFALCAAVDTPLDADTCASLRSLLRKCANLRAEKSEVDDEVVMLNILATIAGRYFGQSET